MATRTNFGKQQTRESETKTMQHNFMLIVGALLSGACLGNYEWSMVTNTATGAKITTYAFGEKMVSEEYGSPAFTESDFWEATIDGEKCRLEYVRGLDVDDAFSHYDIRCGRFNGIFSALLLTFSAFNVRAAGIVDVSIVG